MARNQVFISYSHQDEKLFQEFKVHLKPWEERETLAVWDDLRIKPSQKWHEEIQEAVRSTAVAVLLISPDFMASDYIQKHELPPFLKAAEERQLALACLYLRTSQVADDDYAFTVTLDSGETRRVKLSDYQGLNKPGEILSGKPQGQRDELFISAVQQIKALYKQHAQEGKPKPPPSGQRHELTIRLELSGNHLFRTFHSQHTRLATGYSVWPPSHDPGTALYETLFGAGQEDQTGEVLQPLFPKAVKPTPIFSPVRVRIQTTEPSLAELPWTQTTWDDKRLWDYGWTFELLGEATDDEIAAFPNPRLQPPCPVLLIAPGTADSESHLLALEGRLDHAWPAYREHPPHIKTQAQLKEALQKFHPCIVYYYGRADGDSKILRLHLDDGPLDVNDLPKLWQRPPRDRVPESARRITHRSGERAGASARPCSPRCRADLESNRLRPAPPVGQELVSRTVAEQGSGPYRPVAQARSIHRPDLGSLRAVALRSTGGFTQREAGPPAVGP